MALPKDVSQSVQKLEQYLFAVMSMGVILSKSSSDDIFNVAAPLQFMGNGVIEEWEILKEYLEKIDSRPALTTVRNFPDTNAE